MDTILSFLSLGFGCFGVIPAVIALAALIDAFRMRADWYWFIVILAFPFLGSIAYFVVMRSSLLGARNAVMMSPDSARRLQARRRLRELEVQLSHWRGPATLAEAGEELLVLGKPKEAEKLLRESQENGGAVEDVNFPLAQALEMQGRWAEAVPLLGALCKAEPDARLGQGPLHLARSLDESGRKDEAEAVLRQVLERRTVIEAQVRLARILLLKGNKEEGEALLAEVRNDARLLPRYLQREHRAWIRAAGRLKSGGDRLPAPRFEGQLRPGHRWTVAAAVAGGLVLLALAGVYVWMTGTLGDAAVQDAEERQRLTTEMEGLKASHPWQAGDLAAFDLQPAVLDRYLLVRRELAPALKEVGIQERRFKKSMREMTERAGALGGMLTATKTSTNWDKAQTAFLSRMAATLEKHRMSPRELEDLTNLVEWRFLGRAQAVGFGVPEYHRQDWISAQSVLRTMAPYVDSSDPRTQRWYEQAEARLADYERQAGEARGLSPATRTLLESRRADLERLSPEDASYLIHGLDPSIPWVSGE